MKALADQFAEIQASQNMIREVQMNLTHDSTDLQEESSQQEVQLIRLEQEVLRVSNNAGIRALKQTVAKQLRGDAGMRIQVSRILSIVPSLLEWHPSAAAATCTCIIIGIRPCHSQYTEILYLDT